MSKCRPSCCSGNSSDSGAVAIVGVIVLAVAVYGIIRAILHVLIEIVEIMAITVGSIGALILLALIASRVIRRQHIRRTPAGPKLATINPASLPVRQHALRPAAVEQGAAELFAEAVANGMDPRFVERILNTAMQRPEQ
jgi:hypothetical protein